MTGIETAAIASFMAANAGTIATAASAGASVIGGLSAYGAGKAQAEQYKQKSILEAESGKIEAEKIRDRGARVAATQRAVVGGGGLELSGSPAQFITKSTQEQEYDALLVRYGANARSAEAKAAAKASSAEGMGGLLKGIGYAGGTILSGKKKW